MIGDNDMFCPGCGKSINDTAKFCPTCGKEIDKGIAVKDATHDSEEAKKLAETVAILYDMEINNYLMKRSIDKLDYDINNKIFNCNYPIKPSLTYRISEKSSDNVENIVKLLVFIILTALGIVLGMMLGPVCTFVFILLGIMIVIPKNTSKKSEAEAVKRYNREMEQYNWQVSRINKKCEEYLIDQRNIIAEKLSKSKIILDNFYKKSAIDPQFCNLVAIGYMHEYIRLNISKKLYGIDGLYYLIKKEIRWDNLSDALNDISNKLDKIINNQMMIFFELQDISQKSDEIVNGIKDVTAGIDHLTDIQNDIRENTALTAYWSKRAAKEQENNNIMQLYYH